MNSEEVRADAPEKIKEAISKDTDSNLLKFDENNKTGTGRDINTKITALDTDLACLRAELSAINTSVEEGLDRLGDTDTDLTAKVSETYKRLGEIDNSYKSLLTISERIGGDINKLNGDVSAVAETSAKGIKSLEKSTVSQTNEFTKRNQQVVSQVNQLVETSKLTSEMMSNNIQSATEKMLLIEKNVISQIDNLTNTTKDKAQSVDLMLEQSKAKIIKLESVDEAIIRRATTLEITTAELAVKGQYIDSSVEQLQIGSDNLSNSIIQLKERTTLLEELTSNHDSVIDELQQTTASTDNVVLLLADRERKHFNIITAGFLMLLVATTVVYFSQQSKFELNEAKYAERDLQVDNKMRSLQQAQEGSVLEANESMAVLENEIEQINHEMINMEDQVQSVEGRLNQTSPLSMIGDDNVIHGSQWISELPVASYTIQLAYVDNKNTLFEIADRYNFQLKESLSYFEANDDVIKKYVLLSGNYATVKEAALAIESLPRYMDMKKPIIRELKAIQAYIAAK